MKTKILDENEVIELSGREESHFFDRKAFGIKGDKIQKVAVAFANADGGEFVIGIADDRDEPDVGKRWQGANSIEEYNSCFQALMEIKPTLDYCPTFLTCNKKGIVLLIDVVKSAFVHSTANNTVYLRVSAQSMPIKDPNKIIELNYSKGASSYEEAIIKDVPSELVVDSKEMGNFLTEYSPKTEAVDFAVSQNLLEYKTWEPRVAGILLFCDIPQVRLPKKCAVKIARYETKEDEPEREHLKDQFTLEGPLYQLIQNTIGKVAEIMSSVKIWTANGLAMVNYPPEAIWEIIVNAIIHRDYSISDDIHINIFDNRIEVLSPGKLPGYVTVENILDSRYARNSKIVRTLNRYKIPPNKDIGEGLNTAFQKMKEWKLKDPIIEEESNYVKVTIPHTPLASPEESIMEFLKTNSTISNRQARDITGIKSENAVKKVFYHLRDDGIIQRVPGLEGPASAWQVVRYK